MSVLLRPMPLPAAPVRRAAEPNATLAGRAYVTATLASFIVDLDEPLPPFRAGQYVSIGVERDGGLVQRPYSIVAADEERRRIELFIRRLPDGQLSNMLWSLVLGARLRVGPPRGRFFVDPADDRPRLLVGTGTGLAPLLAMLGDAAQRGERTPHVLIHGVSYQAELAYAERIAAWQSAGVAIDYRPTVSRPYEERNASWPGRIGRADDQLRLLLDERPALCGCVAYLCGNSAMVESCNSVLTAAGVASSDIRVEHFHKPGSVKAPD